MLGNVQQQGIGQRLGKDDVGLVHEHYCFAKTLSLRDDFHDLFAALGGGESQLDLAIDHQVKAVTGVALVKKDVAFAGMKLARALGYPADFFRGQPVEKRNVGEQGFDIDGGRDWHAVPMVDR